MHSVLGSGRAAEATISVVIPMYNEASACDQLFSQLLPVLEALGSPYEVICVNDGSQDTTRDKLIEIHRKHPCVRIINLSRRFGKDIALSAGLDAASGNAVIPMDADLQDPPQVIPQLVSRWRKGFDMVVAVRGDRSADRFVKRLTAHMFYRITGWWNERPLPLNAGDFRLLDRAVVEAVKACPERTRFLKGLFAWVGFNHATVTYCREPRISGASKWDSWQLWNFALGGLVSFTTLPLRIWTYFGLFVTLIATLYASVIVLRTFAYGAELSLSAIAIALILFFSGMNMVAIGVLGEYLGRVFIEVKQRPLYVIRDQVGFSNTLQPSRKPHDPAEIPVQI